MVVKYIWLFPNLVKPIFHEKKEFPISSFDFQTNESNERTCLKCILQGPRTSFSSK